MKRMIISIDPSGNGSNGVFVGIIDLETKKLVGCFHQTFLYVDYSPMMNWIKKWFKLIKSKTFDGLTLIIEDYIDRGVVRNNSTKALIQKIQDDLKNYYVVKEFVLQQPNCKTLWTNNRLLQNGILIKDKKSYKINHTDGIPTRHALDALRHFMYYVVKMNNNKLNIKEMWSDYEK